MKDFFCVTINFYPAPFVYQNSFLVDNESAAFDATYLFAVHVFHLHDTKEIAYGFFSVGKQFEWKSEFGSEVLM